MKTKTLKYTATTSKVPKYTSFSTTSRKITTAQIKDTVENPDFMNKCQDHLFYLKYFNGLPFLVYAERTEGKNAVIKCYSYLTKR